MPTRCSDSSRECALKTGLLDSDALLASSVVANCAMNRKRGIHGGNGYDRELRMDPLQFVRRRAAEGLCRWLDLCCGTGRALIEAAEIMKREEVRDFVRIDGIDLAGMFHANSSPDLLSLRETSVESWIPAASYDLITCVHGLHYIGDKLGLIAKATACLKDDGFFVANLDLSSIRYMDGRSVGRAVSALLRRFGIEFDRRKRLLRCDGRRAIDWGLEYEGADDQAGPNYTGQDAVRSYYKRSVPPAL